MPKYFVAVFGEPEPGKDTVESGVYTPDPKYAPFPVNPGDLMLLYCTASYSAYSLQVPGVGVVLSADREHVKYRWLPFAQPIQKADLDRNLEADDAANMRNIRFASKWLFEISQQSFAKTLGTRAITWGKL